MRTKKDNVFARADEKFVKTTIVYADSSKVLFYDSAAKTDKVMKEDLSDLFKKGVVISQSGKLYNPVCCSAAGFVANDGTSTALTFTGSDAE